MKTGEANFERRGDDCGGEGAEDGSGDGVRRMDGRRRGVAGRFDISVHPMELQGISILSGSRASPIERGECSVRGDSCSMAFDKPAWS